VRAQDLARTYNAVWVIVCYVDVRCVDHRVDNCKFYGCIVIAKLCGLNASSVRVLVDGGLITYEDGECTSTPTSDFNSTANFVIMCTIVDVIAFRA